MKEGRKNSHYDTGDIDLLLKRSEDNGRTWSKHEIVYEDGGDEKITIGNPVPIVEKNSNRIHLFFTREYSKIFYMRSEDDGLTWTVPEEFTHILKGFNYPLVIVATGPVHGIQMNSGRLIVPVWVCDRTRNERYKHVTDDRIRSGVIYSDDGGETWQTGGLVPFDIPMLHEATVVELTNGQLLINMRAHGSLYRAESISNDAGKTWSNPVYKNELSDPTCQGSIFKTSGNKFLFINPSIASDGGIENRKNLTLRLSNNNGKNWTHSMLINEGPSGYSDISECSDGSIICIFENGNSVYREKISIVKISKNWLNLF